MQQTRQNTPPAAFWQAQATMRELMAVLTALFFAATGLLAAWVATTILTSGESKLDGTAIVALLVVPVLVYAIVSGRLSQFKAGSVEATFVAAAKNEIQLNFQPIDPSEDELQSVSKAGVSEIRYLLEELDESKPIVLNLVPKPAGKYSPAAVQAYIQALLRFRTFSFVTVKDSAGRAVAYVPAWRLLEMLRAESPDPELVRILDEGKVTDLKRLPGFWTETLPANSTYLDALREMNTKNLEAIMLLDEDGKLAGILGREHLLGRLALAAAS